MVVGDSAAFADHTAFARCTVVQACGGMVVHTHRRRTGVEAYMPTGVKPTGAQAQRRTAVQVHKLTGVSLCIHTYRRYRVLQAHSHI